MFTGNDKKTKFIDLQKTTINHHRTSKKYSKKQIIMSNNNNKEMDLWLNEYFIQLACLS